MFCCVIAEASGRTLNFFNRIVIGTSFGEVYLAEVCTTNQVFRRDANNLYFFVVGIA